MVGSVSVCDDAIDALIDQEAKALVE